jgi:hypothetical protein
MTDPDEHIRVLFASDLPPLRDPAFQAKVLAGVMRRRFLQDIRLTLAVSLIGGLGLEVLWPALSPILASMGQDLAPAAVAGAVAASILAFTAGRSFGLAA